MTSTKKASAIGCDYNTRMIWLAHSKNNRLQTRSVQIGDDYGVAFVTLQEALLEERAVGAERLYIEAPWGSNNFRTTMALVRAATLVEVASRVGNILPVEYVHPSTWRKRVLGIGGGRNRKEFKDLAIQEAKRLWPEMELSDDQAEAALISVYGGLQVQEDYENNT